MPRDMCTQQRLLTFWINTNLLISIWLLMIHATQEQSCRKLTHFDVLLNQCEFCVSDHKYDNHKLSLQHVPQSNKIVGLQYGRKNQKFKIEEWQLASDQILLNSFPIDKETSNYVRKVTGAIFSVVFPRPLQTNIKLAAVSADVLSNLLDLDLSVAESSNFLDIVSGNTILENSTPLAHRYGGHQFGYWAGQLGDGRAHLLGEYVNSRGDRWELQLKGSGKTPYSRRGDGYAVIRSSVREFLGSEAMYYLGIPTSRAATLVVSDDPVWRDQFYNGNVKVERAAVVLRLAKSWFRFGSLELLMQTGETKLLKHLLDFIIEQYFTDISVADPNKYLTFFSKIVENTAELVAKWQSVGFTHGVCNTDNFSILSITIDYGPFGFLDDYNPEFVPNTSDDEGRYSYEKQPDVAHFNLNKLRLALSPVLNKNQRDVMDIILSGYNDQYKDRFMTIFRAKLGLADKSETDEEIVAHLLHMMQHTNADFTTTFRDLGDWPLDDVVKGYVSDDLWSLKIVSKNSHFDYWRKMLVAKLKSTDISDKVRRQQMHRINPRYILRNWIAERAIQEVEAGGFNYLKHVHNILKHPFEIQAKAEELGFAKPSPAWAKSLKVSCSS